MRPVDTGQTPKDTTNACQLGDVLGDVSEISRSRHDIAERHDEGQSGRAAGVSHSRGNDAKDETDKSLKPHERG